jgi:hypothetical protein
MGSALSLTLLSAALAVAQAQPNTPAEPAKPMPLELQIPGGGSMKMMPGGAMEMQLPGGKVMKMTPLAPLKPPPREKNDGPPPLLPPAKPPVPEVKPAARAPVLPAEWGMMDVTEKAWQNGCERIALQIKERIGGEIRRILPAKGASQLGNFRSYDPRWSYHEVVVRDGRVFDAFTGHQGLPIDEYKALWDQQATLRFGF